MHVIQTDLARMYDLVLKVPDGLSRLKELLEAYITNQGLEAIDKCCDAALNVIWNLYTFISWVMQIKCFYNSLKTGS